MRTDGNGVTAPAVQKALGLSLAAMTPELAPCGKPARTVRGVIITGVDPNSDAAEQGLQRGDLIMSVNNQPVTSPAQVIAGVEAARKSGRKSVLLLVKRGNTPSFTSPSVSPAGKPLNPFATGHLAFSAFRLKEAAGEV